MPVLLDVECLRASVDMPGSPWRDVEYHATIGSTNARAGLLGKPWRVVVAQHQSEGRGRLSRAWEAPPGTALAVSATVPLPDGHLGWLPLLAGLSVAEAVESVTSLRASLKWPNDVLLPTDDDRKVCGILCEVVTVDGDACVVVGAGVNVSQRREELPVDTATSLALAGAGDVDQTALVAAYLAALASRYASLADPASAADVRADYRTRCATIGRAVRVSVADGLEVVGRAEAVDGEGRLVLVNADGERRAWAAGDVVHARTVAS